MEVTQDLILDDYYKLRINAKKLTSGRFQVKFHAKVRQEKELYGYVLVESSETLKSVILKIKGRLNVLDHSGEYRHFHLYHIGKETQEDTILIFE